MKAFVGFLIAVAVFSTAQAQFSNELRTYNENFNNFHHEVDLFLRMQRYNASEILENQNRMALTTIWDSVLRLKELTEVADDFLIYVALEIGNQNPCIVEQETYLREAEVVAGTNISSCADALYRSQQMAITSGFYPTVDYTQRSSHFLQIITMYTLGLFNPVVDQNSIRMELGTTWRERHNIKSEEQIQEELFYVMVGMQTARINLSNCMALIEGRYRTRTETIMHQAELCR